MSIKVHNGTIFSCLFCCLLLLSFVVVVVAVVVVVVVIVVVVVFIVVVIVVVVVVMCELQSLFSSPHALLPVINTNPAGACWILG